MNDQWMNIEYDEVMVDATNKYKSIEAESKSKEVIEQVIDKFVSQSDKMWEYVDMIVNCELSKEKVEKQMEKLTISCSKTPRMRNKKPGVKRKFIEVDTCDEEYEIRSPKKI